MGAMMIITDCPRVSEVVVVLVGCAFVRASARITEPQFLL